MIAIPGLLVSPAQEAGIKVPDDLYIYDTDKYPHWYVYCQMQLGRRIPTMSEHWNNAKVVANIPEKDIRTVTFEDLEVLGFQ